MNLETGKSGEDLAVHYLCQKGYRIIERNYRTPYGEIDIICQLDRVLVFVEVKTRRNTKFGHPYEAVNRKKIAHLKKAAYIYLQSLNHPYAEVRFDVVSIMIQERGNNIEHIMAAF